MHDFISETLSLSLFHCFLKMQKTLVTFGLTLILQVRILDIPELPRNAKGYLISQNF